ncbi:MAG: hypothetical protein IJV19_03430 [Prevotella sp.]|nr:hypothetical protein [Prevotella sp.]
MRKISEGRKMWFSVMVVFAFYAAIFIIFYDFDRKHYNILDEPNDWNLLWFSLVVMAGLGLLLLFFAHRMDSRIDRQQSERQNKMRRELTQNIGHEFKTPLASIMGYMETIKENPQMDEKTREQFLNRAIAQTKRMSSLLRDLSKLNKLDFAPELLTCEDVNLSDIVSDIVQETEFAVKAQQMKVNNNIPAELIVNGNSQMIYSIFRNLFDNSISYAGKGSTIELSAERQGSKFWKFTFSDNGKGVAEHHLNRLFERFYRIDKGRSRELGGTGLGLSIVKNAIIFHGGNIVALPNDTGKGLKFVFTLKAK